MLANCWRKTYTHFIRPTFSTILYKFAKVAFDGRTFFKHVLFASNTRLDYMSSSGRQDFISRGGKKSFAGTWEGTSKMECDQAQPSKENIRSLDFLLDVFKAF